MGTILLTFWREAAIGGLLLFIVLANQFYVNSIKLERDVAEANLSLTEYILESQSDKILQASEDTQNIVRDNMERLDTRLDRLTRDQRKQIEDLLKIEIPVECGEEFNQFLIDRAHELGWPDE